jgi:hypothetical protein
VEVRPAPRRNYAIPAGAAAAVMLGAAVVWFTSDSRVIVSSDPAGATISVDQQRCAAPCSVKLKPGHHQIDAQLDSYKPLHRDLDVSRQGPWSNTDVKLALEKMPAPPAGRPGRPGRKSPATAAEAPVAEAPKKVEERPKAPVPTPTPSTPAPATLAISGGLRDTEVFVDNKSIGKIGGDGTLSHQVTPGEHRLRLEHQGYESKDLGNIQFGSNQPVDLTPGELTMTASVKVPPPLPPTPGRKTETDSVQQDDQVWNGVDKSSPEALQRFKSANAASRHLAEADKILADLERRRQAELARTQQQAETARLQAEIETKKQQVRATLHRPLREIWPGGPPPSLHATYALTNIGEPQITGDRAKVMCRMVITTTQPRKTTVQPVMIELQLRGGQWVVESYQAQKE